jgi:sulfonate transport system substrate-binding protein
MLGAENRVGFAFAAALFAGLSTFAVRAAEPINLRVAWVTVGVDYPLVLLPVKGVTRHLGQTYTVEDQHFAGTPPMITALGAGELDLAPLAFSALGLAIENAGMTDLRVIADAFQDGVTGYHSTEYMVLDASGIHKVEDLKGKILATNAVGSGVDIAMRAMLQKHGLDPAHDVNIIEIPFPNMQPVLLDHKADLIIGIPPFSYDPSLRRVARTLFTVRDAVGPAQFVIWTARSETLKKDHAAIVDYLEDNVRMLHWVLDPKNHDQVVNALASLAKRPPASFAWMYTKDDEYHDPNGMPDVDSLSHIIEVQHRAGFLKTSINISKYVDLGPEREAVSRLR